MAVVKSATRPLTLLEKSYLGKTLGNTPSQERNLRVRTISAPLRLTEPPPASGVRSNADSISYRIVLMTLSS